MEALLEISLTFQLKRQSTVINSKPAGQLRPGFAAVTRPAHDASRLCTRVHTIC